MYIRLSKLLNSKCVISNAVNKLTFYQQKPTTVHS